MRPLKPFAALLLCSFLGSLASHAPLQAAPTAASVLRDMARAEKTLSFSAIETVERPGAPTVRVKVQRAARKQRLDYLAPDVRRGDAVIDDGHKVWIYLRSDNTAVQTLSRPERDFAARASNVDARVSGASTIDNRLAWIIEMSRGKSQRRLWIDQKNGALLRRETRRSDRLVESSVLSGVRFTAIPASAFDWTPPHGANISQTSGTLYTNANAARRLAMLKFPSWIPRGYSFESAIVDDRKGEAWLRFSGERRFSIFQSRAEHDTPLQKVEDAWFAARGGNRFVIVGLEESDARQLAASL